jgi:hypothetical protein
MLDARQRARATGPTRPEPWQTVARAGTRGGCSIFKAAAFATTLTQASVPSPATAQGNPSERAAIGEAVAARAAAQEAVLLELEAEQQSSAESVVSDSEATPAPDYFTNGAEATAVPTSGPGAAYFQNGAEVMAASTSSMPEPAFDLTPSQPVRAEPSSAQNASRRSTPFGVGPMSVAPLVASSVASAVASSAPPPLASSPVPQVPSTSAGSLAGLDGGEAPAPATAPSSSPEADEAADEAAPTVWTWPAFWQRIAVEGWSSSPQPAPVRVEGEAAHARAEKEAEPEPPTAVGTRRPVRRTASFIKVLGGMVIGAFLVMVGAWLRPTRRSAD